MTHVLIDGEDLYSILRVDRQAGITELRKAYRKRALLYHPDLNREVGDLYRESINEEMRKLNKAKEVLFDHRKRAEYDRRLRRFESGV
jgi:DnaJ-class molecular chaperone